MESVTLTLSTGVQETYKKTTMYTTGCTCSGENPPIYQKHTSSNYYNKFLRYSCTSSSWVTSLENDYTGASDFKPTFFNGATVNTVGTDQCPYSGSPSCLSIYGGV